MSQPASASEQLQRLEQLVPLCSSIRKGTEYGAVLAQATGEVLKAASLPDSVERLEPALLLLRGTPQLDAGELTTALEKLESAGRNLEGCTSTETLKDARFWVKDAQEALGRIESLLTKAWAARVQAEFGPLQRLGAVLAGVPDTKAAGTGLQKWATDALGMAGSGVPSGESVKRFEKAQAELAARLQALASLGIDAAVRTFLLEVASEKATLASLTPGVLDWLRSKNAHSRFCINLA